MTLSYFFYFILSCDYAKTLYSFVNETSAATEETSLCGQSLIVHRFVLLQGWTPG